MWTCQQQAAISTRGRKILVAAGAGTGKTAVLVERIIQGLLDEENPLDLERLLVVTFTDAAAAEMRDRIRQALGDALAQGPYNARLQQQLILLPKAPISTLHSFCAAVIRRYFHHLDLDPSFRVMDENEATLLQLETLDGLFEELYEKGDWFLSLVDAYGGRTDETLTRLVLDMSNYSRSLPQPEQWLSKAAEQFDLLPAAKIEELPWYPPIKAQIVQKLSRARELLIHGLALSRSPGGSPILTEVLEEDLGLVDDLLARVSLGWDSLAQGLKGQFRVWPRKGDCELREQMHELRNQAKKEIKDLSEAWFSRPGDELLEELRSLHPAMKALTGLILEFQHRYQEAKDARGAVDFADLEHLCLRLLWTEDLLPSPVAEELKQSFDEVLVDEYQDINPIQEAILQLISQDNLFMVGDVKQSIYRFRQADHRLFLEKYNAYQTAGDGPRRIDLSSNFRSRPGVLDGINFLFKQLFTGGVAELDYPPGAQLVPGKQFGESVDLALGEEPIEVHLLSGDPGPEEAVDSLEREAALIACRINELVHGGYLVQDKEGYRPVTYGDMAVLLRTTKARANTFQEVFQQAGIPVYAELGTGYFAAVEVETILSLLRLIDNPRQEIHLAALLRSPVVGCTVDELALIRLGCLEDFYQGVLKTAQEEGDLGRRLRVFLGLLDEWRTQARRGPLDDLIWTIYQQTGYYEFVGGLPGGEQRQANLRILHQRAREFDRFARPGLFRFLRFLETLQKSKGDLGTAPIQGPGENVVRLMSIHKSKGLEFPVVFLGDLGKGFNLEDAKGDLLFQRDLGVGPKVVDLEGGLKYPSLAHRAVRQALLQETLAEEMRILYVALTRAKEKLILVGTTDVEKIAKLGSRAAQSPGWALPEDLLAGADSCLDWLIPALARHRDGECLRGPAPLGDDEVARHPSRWQIWLDPPVSAPDQSVELLGKLGPSSCLVERPWVTGPLCPPIPYPAKLSVSELKGRLDAFDGEGKPLFQEVFPRPRFVQSTSKLTPAERGIAMHRALQNLSLDGLLDEKDIQGQLVKMKDLEILTEEQVQAVEVASLVRFFASPLGKRLRRGKLTREVPFSLRVDARQIYGEAGGEEWVLVQGVVDCILDEGDGLLVLDFKTDAVFGDRVLPRAKNYFLQLEYYCRAVALAYGRPVKEAYLYFLAPGELVPFTGLTEEG